MQNHYGLLGRTLKHSFSKKYFTEKFLKMGLSETHQYHLFELTTIDELPDLIKKYGSELKGLNVTIPYKQEVLTYLDEIDEAAKRIGAVNTIKIQEIFVEEKNINNDSVLIKNGYEIDQKDDSVLTKNGYELDKNSDSVLTKKLKLKGYNSDYWGFRWSLEKWADFNEVKPKKALVLGTGGASKAVIVALNDMGIEVQKVSRKKELDTLTYVEINEQLMAEHLLIVNTTPLGMYPNVETYPEIPYNYLTENHLLYDLVYNPLETEFLKKGLASSIKSVHYGLEMLEGQAEKAWEIWNW